MKPFKNPLKSESFRRYCFPVAKWMGENRAFKKHRVNLLHQSMGLGLLGSCELILLIYFPLLKFECGNIVINCQISLSNIQF